MTKRTKLNYETLFDEWDEDEPEDEGRGYTSGGYIVRTLDCTVHGCKLPTTGGKPVCIEHVTLQPYAQKLQAEELEREQEKRDARTKKGRKKIDVRCPHGWCQDILVTLRSKGVLTVAKLAAELNLSKRTVNGFLERLEEEGLVKRRILRTIRKAQIELAVVEEDE